MTQRGGLQTVERAFTVLGAIADAGGSASLGVIATQSQLAESTTHRMLAALVDLGLARRLPDRRYGLGTRLARLGAAATPSIDAATRPVLARLVDHLGETVNLAMLVGDQAEYIAQVPSRHSMRMFTEVGRRVDLHCTGVGKAMLGCVGATALAGYLTRAPFDARTTHTLTDAEALAADVARSRERGYALDEEEQEIGVRCVAVPVDVSPGFAISVSGPLPRMTDDFVMRAVPLLRGAAQDLSGALTTT